MHFHSHRFPDTPAMSTESFLKLLSDDSSFLEQVKTAQGVSDVIAIAAEREIVLTPEEVVRIAASSVQELSDEQLEVIAGGAWTGNTGGDYASSAAVGGTVAAGVTYAVTVWGFGFVIK